MIVAASCSYVLMNSYKAANQGPNNSMLGHTKQLSVSQVF